MTKLPPDRNDGDPTLAGRRVWCGDGQSGSICPAADLEKMARFLCRMKGSDPDEPVYYGTVASLTSRPLWTHYVEDAAAVLQEAQKILTEKILAAAEEG